MSLTYKQNLKFPDPFVEYKRVGFTNDELALKTPNELMRMNWLIESSNYCEGYIPENKKKQMLDDVLNLYAGIEQSYYQNVVFKPQPDQLYLDWIDKKIKQDGECLFAILESDKQFLNKLTAKYKWKIIKENLKTAKDRSDLYKFY